MSGQLGGREEEFSAGGAFVFKLFLVDGDDVMSEVRLGPEQTAALFAGERLLRRFLLVEGEKKSWRMTDNGNNLWV